MSIVFKFNFLSQVLPAARTVEIGLHF